MKTKENLFILWTSGEKLTFDEMIFLYAFNSIKQGWWKEVTLIIWGASAQLVGTDIVVQQKLKKLCDTGVHIVACKGGADDLKLTETFEKLGIEVKYWGVSLTEVLHSEAKLITV